MSQPLAWPALTAVVLSAVVVSSASAQQQPPNRGVGFDRYVQVPPPAEDGPGGPRIGADFLFRPLEQIPLESRLRLAPQDRPVDKSERLFRAAEVYAPGGARRPWAPTPVCWQAPEYWHRPLYWEQAALERYGQSRVPLVQPAIAGAHFFGNFFILPYKMGLREPLSCMANLGHCRPGNRTARVRETLPWSPRAALYQTAAVLGGVYVLP